MSYFYLATEAGCPVAVCSDVLLLVTSGVSFIDNLYLKHHSVSFHAGEDNAELLIFIA